MADEIRLVPCGRTTVGSKGVGRVVPVDDDAWENGITAEEAQALLTEARRAKYGPLPKVADKLRAVLASTEGQK